MCLLPRGKTLRLLVSGHMGWENLSCRFVLRLPATWNPVLSPLFIMLDFSPFSASLPRGLPSIPSPCQSGVSPPRCPLVPDLGRDAHPPDFLLNLTRARLW